MLRIAAVCAVVGMLVLPAAIRPGARPAIACTGGLTLGYAAQRVSVIAVGQAIAVGDDLNRAPTITPYPTVTPTAPTRAPWPATPPATPQSPPVRVLPQRSPFPTPTGFSLAGYGVTLRVERLYAGNVLEASGSERVLRIDYETRASIERDLRGIDSLTRISTCGLAAFVPKYVADARYLIFAGSLEFPQSGLSTHYRLRLEGDSAVMDDPADAFANQFPISLTAVQYHRYFEGVAAEVNEAANFAQITAPRVPLRAVLRLAGEIRGTPLITPPDTGSAGLLPQTIH